MPSLVQVASGFLCDFVVVTVGVTSGLFVRVVRRVVRPLLRGTIAGSRTTPLNDRDRTRWNRVRRSLQPELTGNGMVTGGALHGQNCGS